MNIKIVKDKISIDELKEIGKEFYIFMIKGAVDIEKEIIAFGGEYHIDANEVLINEGSKQSDIWGFNIIFEKSRDSWIEYISLINIRPQAGNFDMEVQDISVRERMKKSINSKILWFKEIHYF